MRNGLEMLREQPHLAKDWGRCGLVCNQASVTREFDPSWAVLKDVLGSRLTTLFGPQHGFESTVQDNMIETGHAKHGPTGLPVHSLYSETREPTAAMLKDVDTIVIDLQTVGTRIYTYKYTTSACLRAAKKHGKRVVVLDRPNPIGGLLVEGRVLERDATSFVGEFPIPMRHGLTTGEAAKMFNQEIGAPLEVIALKNWDPHHVWGDLKRHWVLTSPNLPTIDPVYVFPGMVVFEGTNVSEGRGTGLPFQFIGAPFADGHKLVARVKDYMKLNGDFFLRPTSFQPTSQKWAGKECQGVQIHVLDPRRGNSFALAAALVRCFIDLWPKDFKWREPGYEYDFKTEPIKLLYGTHKIIDQFAKDSFSVSDPFWNDGVAQYIGKAKPFLMYERELVVNEVHSNSVRQ